jgi:hypothetical protein
MKPLHYRYTIDVNELDYARLMQLVMKFGTGTGEGGSTPTTLRIALADAQIRTAAPEEQEPK